MSLTPQQLVSVELARNAVSPFDIGACFNAALDTLKRDFWNIVLANFIFFLVFCAVGALSLIPVLGQIAALLLVPPLIVGFLRFHAKAIRGEPAKIADGFSGFDTMGQGIAMYIVMVLLLLVGLICLILPFFYLAVAWYFSWNLLSERQGSFWECMEMSRRAVTPHWGYAFLLILVASIVSYVGIIACGIGIFATLPMGVLMHCAAYQRLFPVAEAPAA